MSRALAGDGATSAWAAHVQLRRNRVRLMLASAARIDQPAASAH